jgi:hypothetical protein
MMGVLDAERPLILEAQVKHYEREARLARENLRDQLAMAALPAMLNCEPPRTVADADKGLSIAEYVAKKAYVMADAMLEERRK